MGAAIFMLFVIFVVAGIAFRKSACSRCGGTGSVRRTEMRGSRVRKNPTTVHSTCTKCKGTGKA